MILQFRSLGRLFKQSLPSSVTISILVLLIGISSSAKAATIVVPAGGDLQSAIYSAQLGDTIVLQAGATYDTAYGFILEAKSGSGDITIQSSNIGSLVAGVRIMPSSAANMPTLRATNNNTAVFYAPINSGHYKLVGLELTISSATIETDNGLIVLGDGT